jgi:hypothetical protein
MFHKGIYLFSCHLSNVVGNEVLKQLYSAGKATQNIPEYKKIYKMQCNEEGEAETSMMNRLQKVMFPEIRRFIE